MFHDAYVGDIDLWNTLFADDDLENVVMDTHRYYAWWPRVDELEGYCNGISGDMRKLQSLKYDVWVGEWSLATDSCALWLEGFNNNHSPPTRPCKRVECPRTYMKEKGVDFDRTLDWLGPIGKYSKDGHYDHVLIKKGTCSIDSDYWEDDVMRLGQCTLDAFNENAQAQFFWTVRNELEPRWSYVQSYDNGWIKNKSSDKSEVFLQ